MDSTSYRSSDDPEAEALVVQQKVKVGEDTSSAVAHKQRSCFKSGGTGMIQFSVLVPSTYK